MLDDSQRCHAEVRQVYTAAGAANRLQQDVFPGPHAFSGRVAFDFFAQWLG